MRFIFIFLFCLKGFSFGYFDANVSYIVGKNGYTQNDVDLSFGKKDWWFKTFYYSWKNKNFNRFESLGIKFGYEKPNYTLGFLSGYSPENNGYKNISLGSDIIFSLKPSANIQKRIAGPNFQFGQKSKTGVTQIDLGAQIVLIAHRYEQTDIDLREISTSFFSGFKLFFTNLSLSYSFSSYDKNNIAKSYAPPLQKVYGLKSIFPVFMKSNFNAKLEIFSDPIITPYLSYNRFKSKSNENVDIYSVGSYIDLSMIGIDFKFETYKDLVDKIQRYLTVSASLRF